MTSTSNTHPPSSSTSTSTSPSTPNPLNASLLETTLTTHPRPVPSPTSPEARAASTCTDHMILVRWTSTSGWERPQLQPHGPLSLMPTASVLHYATECFEGLKLYRGLGDDDDDGKLRLFRPERNCRRMVMSAERISLPGFQPEELLKLIVKLAEVDGGKWLDKKTRKGEFLYVRPTLIGTGEAIGIQTPSEALLYVVLVMMPRLDTGVAMVKPPVDPLTPPATPPMRKGLKLFASNRDFVRAWPGGFGYAKVGANYGPSLLPQSKAKEMGFDQILWLFGEEGIVTEAGASNFFVVWKNKDSGKVEIVTAPLVDQIILEGVTRASCLDIAKEMEWEGKLGVKGGVDVVERKFTIDDIAEAYEDGRLLEAFCTGTAYFVASVGEIECRGKAVVLPVAKGEEVLFANAIKQRLEGIMYGREQHEWALVVKEE